MEENIIIFGKVLKGLGIGRKLGFPTLNLNPQLAPKKMEYGIYAVVVKVGERQFKGALHYGVRPTGNLPSSLEVHCIGLNEDLYGQEVEIQIKKRIRDIVKFAGEVELKEAIAKDVEIARSA
ncbi:MAG: riboflavin kinase [Candidatus Gracilibacteria bacterium]